LALRPLRLIGYLSAVPDSDDPHRALSNAVEDPVGLDVDFHDQPSAKRESASASTWWRECPNPAAISFSPLASRSRFQKRGRESFFNDRAKGRATPSCMAPTPDPLTPPAYIPPPHSRLVRLLIGARAKT